jgi:hypothetical protein
MVICSGEEKPSNKVKVQLRGGSGEREAKQQSQGAAQRWVW